MAAKIIEHSKFLEPRGEIYTIYDDRQIDIPFKQDKASISYKGVVRGFHGDADTYKLITCLDGVIQLVVHDVDENYTQTFVLNANSDNLRTVLVPPRHLNAHQCLSKSCIFMYKWSEYYTSPEDQWSVNYNDQEIRPKWKVPVTMVSDRDVSAGSLQDLREKIK
jgi:dTDP-4-dehydrorhamnose 3,5-epimerase|tara:strand:- start:1923 stop:2414 length:492 start_codon:yes stop_codon:yes gene_type:complete